jgi:uncharacterized protein
MTIHYRAHLVSALLSLCIGLLSPMLGAAAATQDYVVDVKEVWIPLKDGVHLSATVYAPKAKHRGEKFGAVLEFLPYRKDESSNHAPVHHYFATHGYVSAHVDMRGTGRSEGDAPAREYSKQEQVDAEQVIAWLAHQKWSNGGVGMFGISWGGFNSIQLAMRHPPGLKAIIAVDATEKLFNEDVHFIDGMMHADEYELNVDILGALTRSPDFPIDEASLAQRFDNPPWFVMYKQHGQDGAFWDEPISSSLESIQVPMFLIGGMLDGYRDSIPRMLEHVKAPAKALLGPWNHSEPHEASPGPAIEWRDQAVEWWDHWIKGANNGAMKGPKLAVYMNHWYVPSQQTREIPGEWRAEAAWPPKDQHPQSWFLTASHALSRAPTGTSVNELAYRPAATQEGGGPDFWWGDIHGDQRSVDAYSLIYDSPPLTESVSILGRPRVCLKASSTSPSTEWFARLSDVAPDGVTTLVAAAGLAGVHRESMRTPTPWVPGQVYDLCIELHMTAWVFPEGHRLHVAVSNSMWPMIWPTPDVMTTSLHLGGDSGSRIELPVVPAKGPLPIPQFRMPETDQLATEADSKPATDGEMSLSSNVPGLAWTVSRDPARQQATVEWRGGSSDHFTWGEETVRELLQFHADDLHPALSSVHGEAEIEVRLPKRTLLWRGLLNERSDHDYFYVQYERQLLENGVLIRTKSWDATVPRHGQ